MLENYHNNQERREVVEHIEEASVCGYKIGITAPFRFDSRSFESMSSDVPDTTVCKLESKDGHAFDGNVNFVESEENGLSWNEESKTLTISGESSDYLSGHALIYKAIQVAEHLRQMDGQVTTHGSAVRFPNGKAVIIMGNSGAGKTSTIISLCRSYGAELIGNDQIVFDAKDNLKVIGGTKDVVIRKVATKQNLPDLAHLFSSQENSWKTKRTLQPQELNMGVCIEPADVCAVVWIHLDADRSEAIYMKRILPIDIVDSLNISERFSRQISGVQSPLIDDNGNVGAFGISLDNETTRKNRLHALEKFRETGMFYIFGSRLDEIGSAIQHLTEINLRKTL